MAHIILRVPPPPPRQHVRWVCFAASAALLSLMLAQGLPIRKHPFRSWQYLVPEKALSYAQMWELSKRPDFVYIGAALVLTTPTGSNQTLNKPSDWNNNSNSVELVGAGGG